MSKHEKPTKYSKKALDIQILNTYTSVHDLNCGCDNPLFHIVQQIFEKEPEIKQKCLTTGENGDTREEDFDIDGLGPGELEALFAEPEDAATKDG